MATKSRKLENVRVGGLVLGFVGVSWWWLGGGVRVFGGLKLIICNLEYEFRWYLVRVGVLGLSLKVSEN